MFEKSVIRLLLFSFICVLFFSCDKEDNGIEEEKAVKFTSFSFLKKDNPSLEQDIIIDLAQADDNNVIELFIPHLVTDSLVAYFSGVYDTVEVNGEEQISGVSKQDYNDKVIYNLKTFSGKGKDYEFHITGYNGVPLIIIDTNNHNPIESKTEYVAATAIIKNSPGSAFYNLKCKIRGRGNATWTDYPKKPYKIKFDAKLSVFGFPANKDWVLLAEYCDKSLLRTSYMCEVSKAVGIEYTVNYKHVELYLNGDYQGTYILTDQVEEGKNRVQLEDDGYLFEDDNYYYKEPLFFTSDSLHYNFTFKYPNANKGNIQADDDKFNYIKDFINDFEKALLRIPLDTLSYRSYIDIDSFAKWYVAAEIIGNWEPNLFYVLRSRNSKLKIMPMWDAEWSLGLAMQGDIPEVWYFYPYEVKVDTEIWKEKKYFRLLFKDPYFAKVAKHYYDVFLMNSSKVSESICQLTSELQYTQYYNFERWPILSDYIGPSLVALGSWQSEVEYVNNYFKQRIAWMNSVLSLFKE